MISMKDLSRSSSAAYEPLARSTSPYRDEEELDAPLRSRSPSPTPTSQRKVVLSNRRRWILVLTLLVLLLVGMYWRAGLGGDGPAVSRKDEEVALGLEGEVEDGGVKSPVQEDEWRAEELATPSPTQASATEPPTELEETLEDSSDDSVDAEVVEDDVSESIETDIPSSIDEEEPLEESVPELDSTELEVTPVTEAPTIPILNVRPHPRPPPSDRTVASQMRYLSYENHSGFHNRELPRPLTSLAVAHAPRCSIATPLQSANPSSTPSSSHTCSIGLSSSLPPASAPLPLGSQLSSP